MKLQFFEHLNFFLKLIGLSEYAYLKIAFILTLLTFKSIDHVLNVFTSNIGLVVNSGLRKKLQPAEMFQTTLIMIDGVAVFPLIYDYKNFLFSKGRSDWNSVFRLICQLH